MGLSPNSTGFLLIDVQEKLMPKMHDQSILNRQEIMLKSSSLLDMPIIITEQYPAGLGKTVLDCSVHPLEKTAFSCLGNRQVVDALKMRKNWLIAGIESHVCVLQTVRALVEAGYTPIVLQDAISSRSSLDHTSALQEMRAMGVRVSTTETVLFELLQDAKHPHFKAISSLIK